MVLAPLDSASCWLGLGAVALVGSPEVRERPEKRHVVLVDSVGQRVVRRLVEVGGERRTARERSQLDVGDVVDQPAPIRETIVLPGEQAESILLRELWREMTPDRCPRAEARVVRFRSTTSRAATPTWSERIER